MEYIAQSNARLVVKGPDGRSVVPIRDLPFTIGRGSDRSLPLAYAHISREHACIERDSEGYLIHDRGSRHGTFVNGRRITTSRLHSADSIRFGLSRDVVVFESTEDTTTRTLLEKVSQTAHNPSGQSDLERLSLFLKAAQSLGSLGAINDVLCTMLEFTIRLTGAERGFVFLGDNAETLRLECGQTYDGVPILEQPSISHSVVRDAIHSQLDFVVSDVTDEVARGRDSLILNAIRSFVAIPLRSEGSSRLLGLLYLDSRTRSHGFNRTDNDILHAIARQAATLIENVQLLQMERESALLRKELEIAASIQQQIIPGTLPEFAFAHISARTVPCTGVGGDFYDVIPLADGFIAIVADVCGKGVPAALLASMVQGMLHGQVGAQWTPEASLADVVATLNAFVCSRAPREKYLTLAVLRYLHSQEGGATVELVNGGHVAPVIARANGTLEVVRGGDLPVGLLESACFHAMQIQIGIGDQLILVSDGITEAEDAEGNQFGLNRLERHLGGSDPVNALFSAIDTFCSGARPADDQTVLAIRRLV